MSATVNPRSFTAIAATTIGDDNRQWIEVMPTADKVRNGPFYFTVTRDDLETYAQSIRDSAGQTPIDYDHEGAEGGSTRAAGWFTGEARVVDDPDRGAILEAQVEWTPKAAQEIRDGEFRFTSAEFSFANKDRKTGLMTEAKAIKTSTLTNRPFFSELAALAADGAVVWDYDQGVNAIQQKLVAALNPGDPMTWSYWVNDVDPVNQRALVCESGANGNTWVLSYSVGDDGQITLPPKSDWTLVEQQWVADTDATLASLLERAESTAAQLRRLTNPGGGAATSTKEDHVSDELKALAADLGLPEDATDEQISEAVKAAKASADRVAELEQELETARAAAAAGGDRVVTIDKDKLAQLERNSELGVTAHRAQLQAEADTLVKAALDDGRIAPGSKDDWRAAILPEGATELVKAEVDALASLTKGRVPVTEVVVAGDAEQNQLDTVLTQLRLKKPVTA